MFSLPFIQKLWPVGGWLQQAAGASSQHKQTCGMRGLSARILAVESCTVLCILLAVSEVGAASIAPDAGFNTAAGDASASHAPAPFLAQTPNVVVGQPIIRTINTSTNGSVMLQYQPAQAGMLDGKLWSLFFYNTISNYSVYGIELFPGAYQVPSWACTRW